MHMNDTFFQTHLHVCIDIVMRAWKYRERLIYIKIYEWKNKYTYKWQIVPVPHAYEDLVTKILIHWKHPSKTRNSHVKFDHVTYMKN